MYSLKLLGGVSLTSAAGPVAGAAAQRRRLALLALLATAPGRRVSRDKVVSLLWPDSETSKAKHLLADALYELRSALGRETITALGDDVLLDPDRLRADVGAFRGELIAGNHQRAVELYTGPFLDGFHVPDAPEFERWAEGQRTQLAHEYARALEMLAVGAEKTGDTGAAVAWWKQLAATDPFSSRTAVRLMRALAAAGDPATAIRHARLHETLLRAELDASPDPEVLALAQELQARPGARVGAGDVRLPALNRTAADHSIRAPEEPDPDVLGATVRTRAALAPTDTVVHSSGGVAALGSGVPASPVESGPRGYSARHRAGRLRFAPAFVAGLIALGAAGLVLAMQHEEDDIPPIRSVAVLQFENQSEDSTQDFLAEAMTDAVITELGRYTQLDIPSRTSVSRFRNSTLRVPEIARELGVDGIVEGSVFRDGSRIRVIPRLVHSASDRVVWSERYDRSIVDLLSLEREIAAEIARKVRVAAAPQRGAVRTVEATANPQALELYLRGRSAWRDRTRAGIARAIMHFRGAIEHDADFALAHAALADAYRYYGGLNHGPIGPYMDSARKAAALAVQLDDRLSEAHASRAALLTDAAEWSEAEREFERAIALDPANALAHQWYALMLATLNRKDEAVKHIRLAKLHDAYSAPLNGNLSQIETWAGIPPAERTAIVTGREIDPTFPNARFNAALRLSRANRCVEAAEEIARAKELADDNFLVLISEAGVSLNCGDTVRARRQFVKLQHRPDARLNTVYIAMGHVMLGNTDSAFAWLEREEHWGMVKRFELRVSPQLAPLRSDPRYPELLKRVGLEPS